MRKNLENIKKIFEIFLEHQMKLIWPFDSTMAEKWMVNAFRCYSEIVREQKTLYSKYSS